MITTDQISFTTSGAGDIIDITSDVRQIVDHSGMSSGTVTVFAPGATAGITTLEYEPGLLKDFPELMDRLVPPNLRYGHDETWHDGNGFSHLRSALVGPSLTVPFVAGKLTLGTWQQIVFLEFDNRARHRQVVLQVMGE